jgi:hypothetical protein
MSTSIYFIELGALMFSENLFTVVIYSRWIFFLYKYEGAFLSLLKNSGSKSALSVMSITMAACFPGPFTWNIFFHSFA